jgi:hypothetical protein
MKSHFLEGVVSESRAREALCSLLPGQEQPWLLRSPDSDPIAFFSVGSKLDGEPNIRAEADISGRHFARDSEVVGILRQLQTFLGGVVTNDA